MRAKTESTHGYIRHIGEPEVEFAERVLTPFLA